MAVTSSRTQMLAYRAVAMLAVGAALVTGALMALSTAPRPVDTHPRRHRVRGRTIASVNDAGEVEPIAEFEDDAATEGPIWPPTRLNPDARLRLAWDLSMGRPASHDILFTFDDGPNPGTTDRLLRTLSRAQIHAVFFVCGWRLESGEEPFQTRAQQILRDIVAQGHIVGNHTVHHRVLPQLSREQVVYEIEHNADLIERVIGERPYLFRPPYGAYSEDVRRHIIAKGNELWLWSIDPHDYLLVGDSEAVAQRVILEIANHAGGTVLLHDTHPWSVNAVPKILRWIEETNRERETEGRPPYVILDAPRYFEGARARLEAMAGATPDAGGNTPADAGIEPTTGVVSEGPADASTRD